MGGYQDPEIWSSVWNAVDNAPDGQDLRALVLDDPVYHLLRQLYPPQQHQTILEVGCGSARITLVLARDFDLRATLLDFSPRALELAGRAAVKLGVDPELILGNALDLSRFAGQYDIVWSGGVYEHFVGAERQCVFDEAVRACKIGGRTVVIVPNALNLPSRIGQFISQKAGRWRLGVEVPFSPAELRARLASAGAVLERTDGTDWMASYWLAKAPGGRWLLGRRALRALNLAPGRWNRWFGRYIGVSGVRAS